MFKKYKKQLILSSLVILLPIVFGLLLWDQLPDTFATHWGVDGQPDGWMKKGLAVFLMPSLMLAMQFFCVWITDLTNRGNEQSPKVMNLIFWIVPVLSLMINGMVYATSMGKTLDMVAFMPIALGLLFAVIGNYMPKCTRNSTIGIKVKWTLQNDENWNATHRFAGKTWVAGGVITMLSAFLPTAIGYPVMFVSLLGVGLGSFVYSWLYHRKQVKAGTATIANDIYDEKTTVLYRKIGWFVAIPLLIFCGFILLSGSIEYDFQEEALVMDASFYSPITLPYENIEAIEYREGDVDGVRTNGFGSWKLLLGFFENEEFGTYSRYTYYKPEGCIVITAKGKTLVISGKDAAETQAIFQKLLNRIG